MPVPLIGDVIMIDHEDLIVINDEDEEKWMMIDGDVHSARVSTKQSAEDDIEMLDHDPSMPNPFLNRSNGSSSTSISRFLSASSSSNSIPIRRVSSQTSCHSSPSPSSSSSIVAPNLGSKTSPIDLSKNDLEMVMSSQPSSVKSEAQVSKAPVLNRSMKYQPGSDDFLVEIEDDDDEESVRVTSTAKLSRLPAYPRRSYPQRNALVVAPYKLIDSVQVNSGRQIIRPGKYVELADGDFMQIKAIVCNSSNNEITLRGIRLQRCSVMNGMLEKKLNELCYFYEQDLDDPRPPLEQCVNEISLAEVTQIRNVRSTNQKFPLDRNMITVEFQSQAEAAINGGLTVRWKYTCKFETASHRNRNEYCERTIEHIGADESQGNVKSSDKERRFEWRGKTVPGGSYQPFVSREVVSQYSLKNQRTFNISNTSRKASEEQMVNGVVVINLETGASPIPPQSSIPLSLGVPTPQLAGCIRAGTQSLPKSSRIRAPGQMLTYGDAFCGTGGTTRGAVMAGLKVKWGFDINTHACASWRENFPNAENFEVDSSTFVQIAQQHPDKLRMKVDILHLSPPCQFFSVAHSTPGKKDEENSATLFAVRDVIDIAKPRVVTLEQTFGIMRTQFMWYLAALIQMFTSLDFSLTWAVVPLAEWGLPQSRKRLIMIASCPGEILPRLPTATHSRNGERGLKTFVTVNQTLRQVRRDAPNHNVEDMREKNEPPWDGDSILPRAMTCSGGQNYHPTGKRDFTDREYAVLQGFPPTHVFKGSYVRKQIGNAVPPSVAKVLFESIKRDLVRADGIEEEKETLFIE